jgi:hypothetical protein
MKFRPISLSCRSNPSIESGDVGYVSTRKGTYQTVFTNVIYSVGQSTKITCDAESPARNSTVRYDAVTKAIVETRKNTETKLTTYDLLVQQMTALIAGGYGLFKTDLTDSSGGTIYFLHDKPTMAESTVRWFTTSEGMIEQNQVDGVWVTVSGTDKQGNALYNTLTARKISADIIRTGKIYSDDGSTLIDMAYGVANSDNISESENIQAGFPLVMKLYIDSKVSKIAEVYLNYDQQNFRTYSDTASSGGGSTQTSGGGGGTTATTNEYTGNYWTQSATQEISAGNTALTTNSSDGSVGAHTHTIGNHSHTITTYSHNHYITMVHNHNVSLPTHTHSVTIPTHTHSLNFGIQEQVISDYSFTIYVDGTAAISVTNDPANIQGILDLTSYITTIGWHTIEIRSTTLKRVSVRATIKSYIKM